MRQAAAAAMVPLSNAMDGATSDRLVRSTFGAPLLGALDAGVSAWLAAVTPAAATPHAEMLAALLAALAKTLDVSPAMVEAFTETGSERAVLTVLLPSGAGAGAGAAAATPLAETKHSALAVRGAAHVLQVALDGNPTLAQRVAGITGLREALAAAVAGQGLAASADGVAAALHVAGALVNLSQSLAVAGAETEEAAAATATATLPLLMAQVQAFSLATLPPPSKAMALGAQMGAAAAAAAAGGAADAMDAGAADALASSASEANAAAAPAAPTDEQQELLNAAQAEDAAAAAAWNASYEVLQLTLEQINNLAAGMHDDEDDAAVEEWDSDDEERMDQMAAGGGGGGGGGGAGSALERRTQACLREAGTLEHLMALLERLLVFPETAAAAAPAGAEGAAEGASMSPAVLAEVCELRSLACLSLGQLVPSPPAQPAQGGAATSPVAVWQALAGYGRTGYEEALRLGPIGSVAEDWLSALTGTMASLTAATADLTTAHLPEGSGDFLRLLAASGPAQDMRANAVDMLAALCVREAPGGAHEAALVGSILAALEDGAVLVQAQAIDKLMDIFSDDYVRDAVYVASGCQEKASTAIDALKAKLRNVDERKALGREEQAHCKEVALNGVRFLKYKAKNVRR